MLRARRWSLQKRPAYLSMPWAQRSCRPCDRGSPSVQGDRLESHCALLVVHGRACTYLPGCSQALCTVGHCRWFSVYMSPVSWPCLHAWLNCTGTVSWRLQLSKGGACGLASPSNLFIDCSVPDQSARAQRLCTSWAFEPARSRAKRACAACQSGCGLSMQGSARCLSFVCIAVCPPACHLKGESASAVVTMLPRGCSLFAGHALSLLASPQGQQLLGCTHLSGACL